MKICYFGIFDPNFSRSRVILKGLALAGVEVVVVNDRTPSLRKYIELWKKHRVVKGTYDAMIVGFPGYLTVFFAKLLSNKPIIYDAYISYYDGLLDRRNYSKMHPKAILARFADYMSSHVSVAVLTINEAYKKFFVETIHIPAHKMHVLRKGADTDLFYPRPGAVVNAPVFIVGWWGSFIPLHGLQYIVDAAEILEGKGVQIDLIGRGQLKDKITKEIQDRGLKDIATLPPIPYADLPATVSKYEIILGIFNDNPKAFRCITNKVFEALALGKAIITEDSPANREIFTNEKDILFVPPGDSKALADAIIRLKNDRALREKIAKGGLDLFQNNFTMEKLGVVLKGIIEESCR